MGIKEWLAKRKAKKSSSSSSALGSVLVKPSEVSSLKEGVSYSVPATGETGVSGSSSSGGSSSYRGGGGVSTIPKITPQQAETMSIDPSFVGKTGTVTLADQFIKRKPGFSSVEGQIQQEIFDTARRRNIGGTPIEDRFQRDLDLLKAKTGGELQKTLSEQEPRFSPGFTETIIQPANNFGITTLFPGDRVRKVTEQFDPTWVPQFGTSTPQFAGTSIGGSDIFIESGFVTAGQTQKEFDLSTIKEEDKFQKEAQQQFNLFAEPQVDALVASAQSRVDTGLDIGIAQKQLDTQLGLIGGEFIETQQFKDLQSSADKRLSRIGRVRGLDIEIPKRGTKFGEEFNIAIEGGLVPIFSPLRRLGEDVPALFREGEALAAAENLGITPSRSKRRELELGIGLQTAVLAVDVVPGVIAARQGIAAGRLGFKAFQQGISANLEKQAALSFEGLGASRTRGVGFDIGKDFFTTFSRQGQKGFARDISLIGRIEQGGKGGLTLSRGLKQDILTFGEKQLGTEVLGQSSLKGFVQADIPRGSKILAKITGTPTRAAVESQQAFSLVSGSSKIQFLKGADLGIDTSKAFAGSTIGVFTPTKSTTIITPFKKGFFGRRNILSQEPIFAQSLINQPPVTSFDPSTIFTGGKVSFVTSPKSEILFFDRLPDLRRTGFGIDFSKISTKSTGVDALSSFGGKGAGADALSSFGSGGLKQKQILKQISPKLDSATGGLQEGLESTLIIKTKPFSRATSKGGTSLFIKPLIKSQSKALTSFESISAQTISGIGKVAVTTKQAFAPVGISGIKQASLTGTDFRAASLKGSLTARDIVITSPDPFLTQRLPLVVDPFRPPRRGSKLGFGFLMPPLPTLRGGERTGKGRRKSSRLQRPSLTGITQFDLGGITGELSLTGGGIATRFVPKGFGKKGKITKL